jgi:Fur family transcriptional regulator, zinc uptake regulator
MDVDSALKLLKDHGYKYTGKREKILELFFNEKRYMPAKEVRNLMEESYPNLSFDTVYRNLSLLEELGILEATEFQGERQFRISCSSEDHHHHHVICTKCKKTIQLDLCPMQKLQDMIVDFKITGHKFEIYGYCSDCG